MKLYKVMVTLMVIAFSAVGMVFAIDGEKSENKSFTVSGTDYDSVKKSYEDAYEKYNDAVKVLDGQIEIAFKEGNVIFYREVRKNAAELQRPQISKEQTEMISKQMISESNKEKKDEIYAWLLSNSRHFNPCIRFVYDTNGDSFKSKASRSFTIKPGESVTAPDCKISGYDFKGWKAEDGKIYNVGDKIEMPYVSLTLTAVLEKAEQPPKEIPDIEFDDDWFFRPRNIHHPGFSHWFFW